MVCSEVIKVATKKLHAEAEAVLLPRIKNIKNQEDYNDLLALFFGFYSPVETLIGYFIHPDFLPDIDARRKSGSIKSGFSSGTFTTMAAPPFLPEINNLSQAFGAMYVLEGSTLGGKIICQMLQANNFVQFSSQSLQFFNVYGDRTFEMWNRFKTVMDALLINEADIKNATVAAGDTFIKLKTWIKSSTL